MEDSMRYFTFSLVIMAISTNHLYLYFKDIKTCTCHKDNSKRISMFQTKL